MRLTYYYNKGMEEAEIERFIDFINQAGSMEELPVIDIYLFSLGGYNHSQEVLKRIIENSPMEINLYASGEVSSAAFLLFYFCGNVNKYVLDNTVAVLHTASRIFEERDLRSPDKYTSQLRKHLEVLNDQILEVFKAYKVLPPALLKDYLNGVDVLLLTKELRSLMTRCPYGKYIK